MSGVSVLRRALKLYIGVTRHGCGMYSMVVHQCCTSRLYIGVARHGCISVLHVMAVYRCSMTFPDINVICPHDDQR